MRRDRRAPKKTGRRAPFSLRPTRAHPVARVVARTRAVKPPLATDSRARGSSVQFPRQGRALGKKGVKLLGRWVTIAGCASALAFVLAGTVEAVAATVCQLPSVFALTVEEGPLVGTSAGRLIVVRADAPSSLLQPGDIIRQANARRTNNCRELEAAAADATARGLLLLLAAERGDGLVTVALADATRGAVAIAPAERAAAPAAAVPAP